MPDLRPLAGLARRPTFTASGKEVAGTFQYVSPEQRPSPVARREKRDADRYERVMEAAGMSLGQRWVAQAARENPDWDGEDWKRFWADHPELGEDDEP